jgi:hypothetical protein
MENQTGKSIPRLIAASLGAWLSASVANADFDTISGIEPEATARWHAGGGQTVLRFDPGVMESLNIKISGSELPHKPGHPEEHGQEISSLSTLDIWAPAAAFDGFASGKLTHRGDLVMDYPGGSVSLANFTLRPASPEILELVTESGEVLFTLEYIHMMLYPDDKEMTLENMDIRISPALAARMGEPRYTGIAVGQAFAQTHLQIPTNARTTTTCTTPNWHDGVNFFTDVELLSLGNVQQMAREAGVRVAIAPSASLANAGTADVPWYEKFTTTGGGTYPQPYDRDQHPFLAWALYRESNGVFEQLAVSELKHAFFTVNTSCSCSGGSILWSAGSSGDVGCRDVYSTGNNDLPTALGVRAELEANSGEWEQCGSMFAPGAKPPGPCDQEESGSTEDEYERRLVVAESELETAGANYFLEGWYVIRDDVNIFNNMARVPITPELVGDIFIFSPGATTQGAAIDEWVAPSTRGLNEEHVRIADAEGHLSLAVKVQDLGAGNYRYVYALMNYDFDPQFNSLAVNLPAALPVENVTFSDSDGDPATDWTDNVGGGMLVWTAPSSAAALDWGNMATFSFEIESAPNTGLVTLSAEESPAEIPVTILGPSSGEVFLEDGFEDL